MLDDAVVALGTGGGQPRYPTTSALLCSKSRDYVVNGVSGDLVRAGAVFHNGKLLERPTDITPPAPPSDGDQHNAGLAGVAGGTIGTEVA